MHRPNIPYSEFSRHVLQSRCSAPTIPVTCRLACSSADGTGFSLDFMLPRNSFRTLLHLNFLATTLEFDIKKHCRCPAPTRQITDEPQPHYQLEATPIYRYCKARAVPPSWLVFCSTMAPLRITDAPIAVIHYCLADLNMASNDTAALFNELFAADIRDAGQPLFTRVDVERVHDDYEVSSIFVKCGGLYKYLLPIREAAGRTKTNVSAYPGQSAGKSNNASAGDRPGPSTKRPGGKEVSNQMNTGIDGIEDREYDGKRSSPPRRQLHLPQSSSQTRPMATLADK